MGTATLGFRLAITSQGAAALSMTMAAADISAAIGAAIEPPDDELAAADFESWPAHSAVETSLACGYHAGASKSKVVYASRRLHL